MNIRELARICGVSPATVSRALSGGAPVNAKTRKMIEDAARKHNYGTRPPSRSKGGAGNGTVAVLLPKLEHTFFQHVLGELELLLKHRGNFMAVLPERLPDALERLDTIKPDGVVLLSEDTAGDVLRGLRRIGLSAVLCAAMSPGNRCPAVHVDDLAAAYDGMNYLLDLGHRDIGIISDSPRSISSGFQRIAGCRKALEDHGVQFREERLFSRSSDYDSGYDGAMVLFEKTPELTAVFAHSDVSAMGVMAALVDLGRRVPQDVSVLGFDDTRLGKRIRPRLTCVHQPIRDIVKESLELLLEAAANPARQSHPSVTLPHSITVRDSCRAI